MLQERLQRQRKQLKVELGPLAGEGGAGGGQELKQNPVFKRFFQVGLGGWAAGWASGRQGAPPGMPGSLPCTRCVRRGRCKADSRSPRQQGGQRRQAWPALRQRRTGCWRRGQAAPRERPLWARRLGQLQRPARWLWAHAGGRWAA
jgi:hypothetical protein